MTHAYTKIGPLKSPQMLRERLIQLDIPLPVDDEILTADQGSPLSQPFVIGPFTVGNRWCIHPMEGWDAQEDGSPTELTFRRWENFGRSGAKLIWGGEAAAVQGDGRANPNQLLATAHNRHGLAQLLARLRTTHRACCGTTDDLLVGLQLTHSGRFSRPQAKQLEPRIAYHHPLLDGRFGISPDDDSVVWTDSDLEHLVDAYMSAARIAYDVGFQFVDVKACHGYLLHEFLSARCRPGRFGGDYAGRTRLLKTIVARIRGELPDLLVGVRVSVFDTIPYQHGATCGEPLPFRDLLPYEFGFGVDVSNPLEMDLTEPIRLLDELRELGVAAANLTCGSPYYNPHIQRPAMFPPSDGYPPPEDPLRGVQRLIMAARRCKESVPGLPMVGTGYTYLQDFLPHVAQAVVRQGWIDAVGIGRMVLSYPELPMDCLTRGVTQRKKICRTFSDCTTAPRNGLVSGCYPLDDHYRTSPAAEALKRVKAKENKEKM